MLKKWLIFFIVCGWFKPKLFAQVDSCTHIVYFELFGSGDIYTFNYEHVMNNRHAVQVGISWLPGTWQLRSDNDRSFFYFPLAYHYLYGLNPKHKLDLSAGVLYTLTVYNTAPNNHRFTAEGGVCYRYTHKHLFARTGIELRTPWSLSADVNDLFFYTSKKWLPWPAFSLGWKF